MKKLFVSLLLFSTLAMASDVGSLLPAWEFEDAQEKPQTLDESVRRIYATWDRQGDKVLAKAMEGLDQSILDAQQAIVIAEISKAPFFVKAIIRSSLEDRSYNSWIDSKGDTRKLLPYKNDQVAVIELEKMRITAVRHHAKAGELRLELGPPASK